MRVVVFEDERVAGLDPVALCRPAFAIHCGSRRLVDLLAELDLPLVACVRPHLAALVEADFSQLTRAGSVAEAVGRGPGLLVNARLVPSRAALAELRRVLAEGRPVVAHAQGAVAAALLPGQAPSNLHAPAASADAVVAAAALHPCEARLPLFDYPHEIVAAHLATLADHLAERIARGTYRQLADGVFAAEGATLGPYVVTDTKAGPIVLDEGASVGAYSLVSGPAHLGAHCRVLEHAAIKHASALGHTTKIGGEVEASIIEPYTNKQHHGFLGHSYLGSWINLGAGTCNSDLKNTYGVVNMEYRGRKVPTGMQFIGAIIGDYSKTAINTGIFTGKVIGVGSMVYGFVTTNVPSFVNYARLFSQVSEVPVEVLVSTQRRMFERRGVLQRPCDIQLLHDVHELTAHERQLPGETLSIEPLSL